MKITLEQDQVVQILTDYMSELLSDTTEHPIDDACVFDIIDQNGDQVTYDSVNFIIETEPND